MKIILLTIFSLLLTGCNWNPNKEQRIQTLEMEMKILKTEVTHLEAKIDSLNILTQKFESEINLIEKD